ncbi:12084_t:CDS:2 [Ambispora leptoticha]|uniref:12084_t:CDS:1 n=1 Tax=Ambispora leptoticha TaxID=144679 RepID=A0A9N8V1X9_9GLOM|nr:12084_t:CDS:2 [Ambispora leptoticha]
MSFPLEYQSNAMFFPQPGNTSGQDRKDPTAGRTFQVKGNPSVAYRRLWGVLNANQIRREVRENRYYEKPTVKRKRLARERHRKLFKEAVAKKVTLIMQMKQRGKIQDSVKPVSTGGLNRQTAVYRDANFHDYVNNNPDILLSGIGEYRYVKTLGVGKFSQVNLATHVVTGEEVAVKIIDKTAYDQRIFKRLYREAFLLEQLNHPNIIRLYEVIETKHTVFLIMEYVDGYNLETYLDCHQGFMGEEQARNIFSQLVEAVQFCHTNHIVHRDLKPPNVLISKTGIVKLADFGLANKYSEDSRLMTLCGSMLYYSPEIVCGLKYKGPEVDVWCLGVLLYRIVVGRDPFKASTVGELKKQICSGRYRMPKVLSAELQSTIRKLLNVDGYQRVSLDVLNNDAWLYPISIGTPMSTTSSYYSSISNYLEVKPYSVKRVVYCDARKNARSSHVPNQINDACHDMELNLFHLSHELRFGFSILRKLRAREFTCYYSICRPTPINEILAIVAFACQLHGISYTYKNPTSLECVYRRTVNKEQRVEKTTLFEISLSDPSLKGQLGKICFSKQKGSVKAYKRACDAIVKSMSVAAQNE